MRDYSGRKPEYYLPSTAAVETRSIIQTAVPENLLLVYMSLFFTQKL